MHMMVLHNWWMEYMEWNDQVPQNVSVASGLRVDNQVTHILHPITLLYTFISYLATLSTW
jgi:hypothetical protein